MYIGSYVYWACWGGMPGVYGMHFVSILKVRCNSIVCILNSYFEYIAGMLVEYWLYIGFMLGVYLGIRWDVHWVYMCCVLGVYFVFIVCI